MGAFFLQHFGDVVFVAVGADQDPGFDAVAFDRVDLPTAGGPPFCAAQGLYFPVLASDAPGGVYNEDGVVHSARHRIALRVGQEHRYFQFFDLPAEPQHPIVGLGQYPVCANPVQKQVAGYAQLRGDGPLGPGLGRRLHPLLHQFAVVVDVAGYRRQVKKRNSQIIAPFERLEKH